MTDTPGPGGSIVRGVLGMIGFMLVTAGLIVDTRNISVAGALLLAGLLLEALASQGKGGPMGRNRP